MRKAISMAGVLLLALMSAMPVQAQQQTGVSTPSSAALFLHAPDMGAVWTKSQSTPLYATIKNAWDAAVAQNVDPDFARMLAAKSKAEQEVGFSLNPQDVFGPVIQSATVVLNPNATGTDMTGTIAANLKDPAKFDKLFAYIKSQSSQAATQPARVSEEAVGDLTITVFNSENGNNSYAGRANNLWAMSNSREQLLAVLQGNGKSIEMPAQAKTAFAQINKISPDVQFFVDMTALQKIGQTSAGASFKPFSGAKYAAGVMQIDEQELASQYIVELDPQAQKMFSASTQPGQLQGLNYVPQTTWISQANNNVDISAVYRFLREQAQAGDPSLAQQIDQQVATVDQTLGMSLEKDLLPAFGSNSVLALNSLQINPSFPMASTADLLLGIELRDKEKVLSALRTVEEKIQNQIMQQMGMGASTPGQPQQTPPGMPQLIQTENHNGVEIRTFAISSIIPLFGQNLAPSYAVDGNFLLFNLSKDNLIKAIDGKGAGSLNALPALKDLEGRFGYLDKNKVNYISFEAMSPLVAVIKTQVAAKMDPTNPGDKIAMDFLTQLANSLKYSIGASKLNGNTVEGASLLVMKQPVQ